LRVRGSILREVTSVPPQVPFTFGTIRNSVSLTGKPVLATARPPQTYEYVSSIIKEPAAVFANQGVGIIRKPKPLFNNRQF
jgi:hypothetical protein